MNNIKINDVIYKYEFFWRNGINDKTYDSDNKLLPFPEHHDKIDWTDKDAFVQQLENVQRELYSNNKFIPYSNQEYKNCLLCDKKNITTGVYSVNNIRWENGTKHYIRKHNITPNDDFIDFIHRYQNSKSTKERVIARFKGYKVVKNDKRYLKLDRNQILIMDALMEHGGYKIYKDKKNKNIYKYSEHAGLLDFNNTGLEKIIVSGNTNILDAGDNDIYLPKNMIEAYDYEYIFHTHPPTPKPGARVTGGILYEFPSISDMFHFMDHYNDGKTQGSIVIAPEGMYIIRKKVVDDKKIFINEDKFYNDAMNIWRKIQINSINKYGTKFTTNMFYSKIAQDRSYINMFNKVLNKYKIHIDYYSRIHDGKNWVIDTIYLPVYAIEFKREV